MTSTVPLELTAKEAADLIGCHVETFRRWVRRGLVPVIVRPGGRFYRRSDIVQIRDRGVAA